MSDLVFHVSDPLLLLSNHTCGKASRVIPLGYLHDDGHSERPSMTCQLYMLVSVANISNKTYLMNSENETNILPIPICRQKLRSFSFKA